MALSVGENGVLNSPTNSLWGSLCDLDCISVSLKNVGTMCLGKRCYKMKCHLSGMFSSLMSMWCSFLSFLIVLWCLLCLILEWHNILLLKSIKYFFPIWVDVYSYIVMRFLIVAEVFSFIYLFIFSVSQCLFIGESISLILTDMNDQWLLIPIVLLLLVVLVVCVFMYDCVCLLPFFWFCLGEIIYPCVLGTQ